MTGFFDFFVNWIILKCDLCRWWCRVVMSKCWTCLELTVITFILGLEIFPNFSEISSNLWQTEAVGAQQGNLSTGSKCLCSKEMSPAGLATREHHKAAWITLWWICLILCSLLFSCQTHHWIQEWEWCLRPPKDVALLIWALYRGLETVCSHQEQGHRRAPMLESWWPRLDTILPSSTVASLCLLAAMNFVVLLGRKGNLSSLRSVTELLGLRAFCIVVSLFSELRTCLFSALCHLWGLTWRYGPGDIAQLAGCFA